MSEQTKQAQPELKARNWKAPFFTIWAGQAVSLLGSQLVAFAIIWYLTATTGKATILASATIVSLLPQIVLGPIAGTLVDRWNRRTVMLVADGTIALATAAMAILFALGVAEIWHIYGLMFVRALGSTFHWPAMQATTSLMVPKENLTRIAGLHQMLLGAAAIVVPPLGALAFVWMPMQAIFAIDVVTAIVAMTTLFFIAIPEPVRNGTVDKSLGGVFREMKEGLTFVWNWKGLMGVIVIAMMINMLANPAFSLMPLMVTNHFGGEAMQLAWLETAFGVGMIGGGVLLSVWGGFKKRILTAMFAISGMGVMLLIFSRLPSSGILIAIGVLLIAAMFNTMANGMFMALMQGTVPADKQGRVFTIVMAGVTAVSPLGLAVAGPVADRLDIPFLFMVSGVSCILLGLIGLAVPAVAGIEEQAAAMFPIPKQAEELIEVAAGAAADK